MTVRKLILPPYAVTGLEIQPIRRGDWLERAYLRPCWICGKTGACAHREPEVERAIFASGIPRKPPAVAASPGGAQ
jgi:hypothetical protein